MTLTRRAPLHTYTRLQRRTPLRSSRKNPVTAGTRARMWRRSGGRCEIRITAACRRRGGRMPDGWQYWQYSHRVRRRDSPGHGPEAGLVACGHCHDWLPAGSHRRWAEKCGWLIRAESVQARDPGAVEVLLPDGRWVLLTAAGGYREVA